MRDIQLIKKQKEIEFSQKYFGKKFESLSRQDSIYCSYAAEVFAYIETVIPEGFRRLTISNFQGFYLDKLTAEKVTLLPPDIAVEARDSICKYCWGKTWKEICNRF